MKVIVGIEGAGHDRAAIDLVSRLRFPAPEVELVDVVPSAAQIAGIYSAAAMTDLDSIMEGIRQAGQEALDRAHDEACARGLAAQTYLLDGYPAEILSECAESQGADLVAVTAKPKGALAGLFAGSVARSLTLAARQSVLVVREPEKGRGPVAAVFATDHSDYANRCLERLLSWKPAGLHRVVVLSAYETFGKEAARFGHVAAASAEEIEGFVAEKARTETEKAADRFRQAGILAETRVVRGPAREAISAAMADTGSDLLILGARGHGLWERLTLGSTALHQVIAEPYSILIVREPEAKP